MVFAQNIFTLKVGGFFACLSSENTYLNSFRKKVERMSTFKKNL